MTRTAALTHPTPRTRPCGLLGAFLALALLATATGCEDTTHDDDGGSSGWAASPDTGEAADSCEGGVVWLTADVPAGTGGNVGTAVLELTGWPAVVQGWCYVNASDDTMAPTEVGQITSAGTVSLSCQHGGMLVAQVPGGGC